MRTAITLDGLLLALVTNCMGRDAATQTQAQPARPNNPTSSNQSAVTPCLFDAERGEVPNCVSTGTDGKLFIAQQFLKELRFDAYGLAPVLSPAEGWMYVNRGGSVVVSGVAVMDNWADSFHDGLVRILRNGKYGFANRKGRIVIPPIYDGAMNFEQGRGTVCKGCQDKCAARDCEHHSFAGGEWFQIDAKGTVLRRVPPGK